MHHLAALNQADPVTQGALSFLGTIVGVFTGFGVVRALVPVLEDLGEPASSLQVQAARCAWPTGEEQGSRRSDEDYLRYPSTRAYLRAVLASPIPHLMVGDQEQLEQRHAEACHREKQAEAKRVAQEKVRAEEQAQLDRMVNLSAALAARHD